MSKLLFNTASLLLTAFGLLMAQEALETADVGIDGLWLTFDPVDGSGDTDASSSTFSTSVRPVTSFLSTSRPGFTSVDTSRTPTTDSFDQNCPAPFYDVEGSCSDLVIIPLEFQIIYPLDELCKRYPTTDKAFLSKHFSDLIKRDKDLQLTQFRVDVNNFIMVDELGQIIVDRCLNLRANSTNADLGSIACGKLATAPNAEWKKVDVALSVVFKKDANFVKFIGNNFGSNYKPVDLVTKLYAIVYQSLQIETAKAAAATALESAGQCAFLDVFSKQELCQQIVQVSNGAAGSVAKCVSDLDNGADFSDVIGKKYVRSPDGLIQDFKQKDLCNIYQKSCRDNDICKDLIFGLECLCRRSIGKPSLEPSSCSACDLPCDYGGKCFYQGKNAKCGCLKLAFGEYCSNDGLVILIAGFIFLVGLFLLSLGLWTFFLIGLCRRRKQKKREEEESRRRRL